MDPIQIITIAISIILTSIFIALGIQLWFLLKELRLTIAKINTLLTDVTKVSAVVGDGAANVSGLLAGIKAGLSLVTQLRSRGEENE